MYVCISACVRVSVGSASTDTELGQINWPHFHSYSQLYEGFTVVQVMCKNMCECVYYMDRMAVRLCVKVHRGQNALNLKHIVPGNRLYYMVKSDLLAPHGLFQPFLLDQQPHIFMTSLLL